MFKSERETHSFLPDDVKISVITNETRVSLPYRHRLNTMSIETYPDVTQAIQEPTYPPGPSASRAAPIEVVAFWENGKEWQRQRKRRQRQGQRTDRKRTRERNSNMERERRKSFRLSGQCFRCGGPGHRVAQCATPSTHGISFTIVEKHEKSWNNSRWGKSWVASSWQKEEWLWSSDD